MRIRKVPSNLQIKVIKWFDYLWLSQKSTDEERSISCLPGKAFFKLNFKEIGSKMFDKKTLPRQEIFSGHPVACRNNLNP